MSKGWVGWIVMGTLAALGVAAGVTFLRRPAEPCAAHLSREDLKVSLGLGTRYLTTHQTANGAFEYEIDYRTGRPSDADNQVRQAGALWGAGLLGQRAALLKGLQYFDGQARATATGGRYPVYVSDLAPEPSGALGTAALVTLAVEELLRAPQESGDPMSEAQRSAWRSTLDGYLRFLLAARQPDGRFHATYSWATGEPGGDASPYSDGEALLALVIAEKYLGRADLRGDVRAAAAAGYATNVDAALKADADSDTTKGYYQWSSMAFYELATSPQGGDAPYGEWLSRLADWMIDVHGVLQRTKNTGYAYEGLVAALLYAQRQGDQERVAKYGCVVQTGLAKLLEAQIGHPRAARLPDDPHPRAMGGILNGDGETGLRIDVVQHQMHATQMALQALFPLFP